MNKNLRNRILLTPTDNKLKLYQEGKKLQVARSAVAVNPLTTYNVSTGNVMEQFANNILTKHGDYGFVGGDTLEVTFDMGTKTVGDVVNCPCRLFVSYTTALQNPSNITGVTSTGWSEQSSQSETDKIKAQDGTSMASFSTNNGAIAQQMLELDLTPLCNQLFSGSNAALKAALKSITADIWAMGSGSNASVLTNGAIAKIFNSTGSVWSSSIVGSNGTASIARMTILRPNDGFQGEFVSSSNKIYVLVYAQYPSDGIIASSVSLDYPKVTIQLNRTVDVVAPKQVYLPKYWAMVGSFSPNWDNNSIIRNYRVFELYKDINNSYRLVWDMTAKKFNFVKRINGVDTSLFSNVLTFNKNQIYKFIVGQNANGVFMVLLKNNNTTEKYVNTDVQQLSGQFQLTPLTNNSNTTQGDMFSDIFQLYDLQSLGKPNGLSDAEAEVILRGIQYPSTSEMVVNGDFAQGSTGWTVNSGSWSFDTGKAVLTAISVQQYVSQLINVLPNSQYTLTYDTLINGKIAIQEYKDGVYVRDRATLSSGNSYSIITSTDINGLRIKLTNDSTASGTFTFDNISLKYVKPSGQLITAVNKELFDINAVTLHSNAVKSGNSIVLNATASDQASTIDIPCLPNNVYQITMTTNGAWDVNAFYGNTWLTKPISYQSGSKTLTFTTPNNCNKIRLAFWSTGVGTYTFQSSFKLKQ